MKDTGSMRYAWFGRIETVMFCGCFWPGRLCYITFSTVREFCEASTQDGCVSG